MNLEDVVNESWLQLNADKFPGSEFFYKEEWGAWILAVGGKQYARYGSDSVGHTILTVKGDPLENLALREEYPEVIPGYYSNKQHWNSVLLADASLPESQLREMLEDSYQLVFQSLTKRLQAEILNSF